MGTCRVRRRLCPRRPSRLSRGRVLGFSYQYLMVSDAKASFSMAVPELPPDVARYQAAGWRAIIQPEPVRLAQLDRVAVRISSSSRLVAAVSVETSDFAYFVGAKGEDITFRAVLNELAAQDSP
jgi:hypothetical protein